MRNKKKLLITWIVCMVIVAAVLVFTMISITKYIDTHTWATLRITGTVRGKSLDAYEEKREFLKGDRISLDCGTTVVVKDIEHDGTVTLIFRPAVIGIDGGEIEETEIAYKESLDFSEKAGDDISANWKFQVVEHRYQ